MICIIASAIFFKLNVNKSDKVTIYTDGGSENGGEGSVTYKHQEKIRNANDKGKSGAGRKLKNKSKEREALPIIDEQPSSQSETSPSTSMYFPPTSSQLEEEKKKKFMKSLNEERQQQQQDQEHQQRAQRQQREQYELSSFRKKKEEKNDGNPFAGDIPIDKDNKEEDIDDETPPSLPQSVDDSINRLVSILE